MSTTLAEYGDFQLLNSAASMERFIPGLRGNASPGFPLNEKHLSHLLEEVW